MLDNMHEQANEPINKASPRIRFFSEASVQQISINLGERHKNPSIASFAERSDASSRYRNSSLRSERFRPGTMQIMSGPSK
ncbi:hypothetical protein [Stratiformator vulcanicus]|uniref:hypothetical protein n=1 Tax=Stratiformator vulcanicus TaxID=2527980 RepID=UPI00287771F1|nr:hypothetical protein [Stratiformator vulcanicus]